MDDKAGGRAKLCTAVVGDESQQPRLAASRLAENDYRPGQRRQVLLGYVLLRAFRVYEG
jgi:hypothetical protein